MSYTALRVLLVAALGVALLVAPDLARTQPAARRVYLPLVAKAVVPARIAFVSERDGNAEIYVVNADGSGLIRVTEHPARDDTPVWSPDGGRIAFVSERDGNAEIYVVNADGSGLVNLSRHAAPDCWPAWSPDSRQVAFVSQRERRDLLVAALVDGSRSEVLASASVALGNPAWSPDGSFVAFSRGSDLYTSSVVNRQLTRVTRNSNASVSYSFAAWSPDGRRLFFVRDPSTLDTEILTVGAGGGGAMNLSNDPSLDLRFVLSPDGQRIAFFSDRNFTEGIYTMRVDGSAQTSLTRSDRGGDEPAWSPDGQRIAFTSQRDGNREIYVMLADGSTQTNLSRHPAADYHPAWFNSSSVGTYP